MRHFVVKSKSIYRQGDLIKVSKRQGSKVYFHVFHFVNDNYATEVIVVVWNFYRFTMTKILLRHFNL